MKQVKFYDIEDNYVNNNSCHGGIILDNGDVICGCCGGILKAEDHNKTYQIVEVYGDWSDLTEEICGDDLYE